MGNDLRSSTDSLQVTIQILGMSTLQWSKILEPGQLGILGLGELEASVCPRNGCCMGKREAGQPPPIHDSISNPSCWSICTVLLSLTLLLTESPIWFLKKGRLDEAKANLTLLRTDNPMLVAAELSAALVSLQPNEEMTSSMKAT
jgi:hypothetical protein